MQFLSHDGKRVGSVDDDVVRTVTWKEEGIRRFLNSKPTE